MQTDLVWLIIIFNLKILVLNQLLYKIFNIQIKIIIKNKITDFFIKIIIIIPLLANNSIVKMNYKINYNFNTSNLIYRISYKMKMIYQKLNLKNFYL